MTSVFWFRRDLRLQDNLALSQALRAGPVLAVSYLNLAEFAEMSAVRQHSLLASIDALNASMRGQLNIRVVQNSAELASDLAALANASDSASVYATEAFDTEGMGLQAKVRAELTAAGLQLVLNDSYYAVAPGLVRKPTDGAPYKVFTPFSKAWLAHGWARPAVLPDAVGWVTTALATRERPTPLPAPFKVVAGEVFALRTLERFLTQRVSGYAENRNRPDLGGTSHLSHALAHGEIHPRTILAKLPGGAGAEVFRSEVCWREFYADVLWHNPHTLDEYYDPKFAKLEYDAGTG